MVVATKPAKLVAVEKLIEGDPVAVVKSEGKISVPEISGVMAQVA